MASIGTFAFLGTPHFAAVILKRLIQAGFIPKTVVTNPDQPLGRKKILTPPPAKQVVLDLPEDIRKTIRVFQPEKFDSEFLLALNHYDFFIVAAFSKIIPKAVLKIPRKGVIGVHPSLLPKLRGASPIQSAILEGAGQTGTTLYLMDEKVDHGSILVQKTPENTELDAITYPELEERLAELSADALVEFLPKFADGLVTPQPQDESAATFTKKFTTQDGFIPFDALERAEKEGGDIARDINRKVRAFNPEPSAFTLNPSQGGLPKRMKILKTKIENGKLKLLTVQYEGKKPQSLLV